MSGEEASQGNSGGVAPPPAASVVEERCPICLDSFQDKAFIPSCFHILKYLDQQTEGLALST